MQNFRQSVFFTRKVFALLPVLLLCIAVLPSCAANDSSISSDLAVYYPVPSPYANATPVPAQTPRALFRNNIDFTLLRAQNNDIIGWVEVPHAGIDYPILKGVDNVFYLDHNMYKESDPYGAIFADMINSFSLDDYVTVLYGHNSKRGDFFSSLHNFVNEEYFSGEENRIAYVYTPEKQMKFEIIAAFRTGNDNLLYQNDYSDPLARQGFIEWMQGIEDENAQLALENVTENDRFLVLSTCTEIVGSDVRHLVIARMLEEV